MKTLLILNDPAYGTERSYNGLRLAGALANRSTLDQLADWTAWGQDHHRPARGGDHGRSQSRPWCRVRRRVVSAPRHPAAS